VTEGEWARVVQRVYTCSPLYYICIIIIIIITYNAGRGRFLPNSRHARPPRICRGTPRAYRQICVSDISTETPLVVLHLQVPSPQSTTSDSLTLEVKRTFARDKSTELHFFYTQTHTHTHTHPALRTPSTATKPFPRAIPLHYDTFPKSPRDGHTIVEYPSGLL